MIRPATPLDLSLLMLLAIIYGSAFSVIKVVVPETGPFALVLMRVFLACLILLPVAALRGWKWPGSAHDAILIGLLCLTNLVVPFFLIAWAQQHLNASLMALLMGAGPFFGMMISHLATKDDRFSSAKAAAVVMGFTGVAIALGADAWTGFSGADPLERLAQAAALFASALYASSGIFVRRVTTLSSRQLATMVLLGSLVLLVAMAPWGVASSPLLTTAPSVETWIGIAYLGFVTTGFAYLVRFHLIRTVGMSYFGLSIYLVPVFGIAIAAFWLSEPIPLSLLIGLGFILGGLVVARLWPQGLTQARAQQPKGS